MSRERNVVIAKAVGEEIERGLGRGAAGAPCGTYRPLALKPLDLNGAGRRPPADGAGRHVAPRPHGGVVRPDLRPRDRMRTAQAPVPFAPCSTQPAPGSSVLSLVAGS